jgi:hypothetical protein
VSRPPTDDRLARRNMSGRRPGHDSKGQDYPGRPTALLPFHGEGPDVSGPTRLMAHHHAYRMVVESDNPSATVARPCRTIRATRLA